eukprot:scaffold283474_cov63-Attheya_sp.AAC.2
MNNSGVKKSTTSKRVIVAVSGTIQDGFELRGNIDYSGAHDDEEEVEVVKAVFLGWGVVRGVRMYFDVKEKGCREFDASILHRVNPACVLTGNAKDCNQYALYLVDERACLQALLDEPRFLTMTPDTLRLEIDDADTSPAVRALARTLIQMEDKSNTSQATLLAVVPCLFSQTHFYPAPHHRLREDGSRLYSFQSSLAKFAGIHENEQNYIAEPGSAEWNLAVAKALAKVRSTNALKKQQEGETSTPPHSSPMNVDLYGSDKTMSRLSRRMSVEEFNEVASKAGISLRAS